MPILPVKRVIKKLTTPQYPLNKFPAPGGFGKNQKSEPFSSPVALFGEAVVPSGASAAVQPGALMNNTGRTIEIHSITFTAAATDFSQSAYATVDLSSVLRVMVTCNDKPLMNNPVPLWLLGKRESVAFYGQRPGVASSYTWRLSKPWHLPPKASIQVRFDHSGATNYDARGLITFHGKYSTGAAPQRTALPYAISWLSKMFDQTQFGTTDSAAEADLQNKTQSQFNVDRLIGHSMTIMSGTPGAPTSGVISVGDLDWISNPATMAPIIFDMTQLRLANSRGQYIVREYTGLFSIFGVDGALEMPFVISEGDFLRASVKILTAADAFPAGTVLPATFRTGIHFGALGWREERT